MKPRKGSLFVVNKALEKDSFSRYAKWLLLLLESNPEIPNSSELNGVIRARQWDRLYSLADSMSSQKYDDATIHFVANQFSQLVRKYPWPKGALLLDPLEAARKTFYSAERRCRRLNQKFSIVNKRQSPDTYHLQEMRSFIRYVIGDRIRNLEWFNSCEFGSGASVGVSGNATHVGRKINSEWSVSPGASTYAFCSILHHHQLVETILPSGAGGIYCYDQDAARAAFMAKRTFVDYNKIAFVPKTAKTHRAIAVEPILNGFLQKGIDQVLRRRLKRIGIDLSNQETNRRMAREGSRHEDLDPFCTIDLSSASDLISTGLVRTLLPVEWFEVLDSCRSKNFLDRGKKTPYSKFCSMGNGFCFPLETLIFVAVCHAAGCGRPGVDFSVYGDDIIVRKSKFERVTCLLKACGFLLNKRKTFGEGPFRESCGADWYDGKDVRPFTLDYSLGSCQDIFKALNLANRNSSSEVFFSGAPRDFLISELPERFRFFRPFKGDADTGIDSLGCEFLQSRNCHFNVKKQNWNWSELRTSAKVDLPSMFKGSRFHEMYAALRGSRSYRKTGKPQLSLRRETLTTVVRKNGGGATSMWLPQQRVFVDSLCIS